MKLAVMRIFEGGSITSAQSQGHSCIVARYANISKDARAICRVLHVHFGTILSRFEDLIAGGVVTTNGIKQVTSESQTFRPKIKDMIASVQSQIMGSCGYFQKYVRGIVCTEIFKVSNHGPRLLVICPLTILRKTLANNYLIESRIYSLPVTGESVAAANDREALARAYTEAMKDMQTLWTAEYTKAVHATAKQLNNLSNKTTEEAMFATRQLKHLKELMGTNLSAGVDVDMIHSRAQGEAAKADPLYYKPKISRNAFWQGLFTKDVFAWFLKGSKEVVDLR
jgi:hypothetical protein